MGWIHARKKVQLSSFDFSAISAEVSHIDNELHLNDESAESKPPRRAQKYHCVSTGTPDDALPFIPKDEVNSKRRPGMLAQADTETNPDRHDWWIVVDNIVYDCTDFILEHPGGEQVIMSFIGEDCSWQFWRFHSRNLMEQYGVPLRIGRTEGVQNRFKEPQRFVGLSRLGKDEW